MFALRKHFEVFLTEEFASCKEEFALVGFWLESANSSIIRAPAGLVKTACSCVLRAR